MSKGRLNSFLKQIQIRCFLLSLFSLNRADNEKMQYSKTSAPGHLFNSTISQKITKKKNLWIKKTQCQELFQVVLFEVCCLLLILVSISLIFILCFNDNPSKMMENTFYFILKVLFVLKIFKSLSRLFGHIEKKA